MSNKVDNKLDFRNVKQTQLDPAQVLKGSFSEFQSALRTFDTNIILRESYTHFIQQVNVDGLPTYVEYWQATSPAVDRIQFGADVAGNKAGTYFTLQEYLTKRTHVFYYIVSGSGTAPGIGDIETPINIVTNDPASVITYATKAVLETIDEFTVTQKNLLSSYLDISYLQFGDTSAVDVGTSGFISSRLTEGTSFKVGEVYLDYDVDGSPIYNGNTLKGLLYNPYTASFDTSSGSTTDPNNAPFTDVEYDVKDVTNSATLLAVGGSNKLERRSITIQPKGKTIWYGFDNTVASGNSGKSFKLTSNSFATIMLGPEEELYALTSSGTAKVAVSEAK